MLNLVVVNVISIDGNNSNRNSDSLISSDWEIDDKQVEPRQYFKINVAPKKIQRSKQATELINRRATASTSESAISQSQDQPSNPAVSGSKQKISNATLKKLLNQSLLRSSTTSTNSSSPTSSGPNKSNFKFVFIQRATAAPGSIKSQQPSLPQQTSSSTQQPSLAASVSRQLASSLLKSAVDIVADNLESAKPSLSALASQLAAANSIPDSISIGSKKSQLEQVKQSFSSASQADLDTLKKTQNSVVGSDKQKGSSGSVRIKGSSGKVKQPSKIYNLPVKFVSNGQPNHVVFSTIKQHFATIKKMQQAAATATKGSSLLNQNFNHKNYQSSANGGKRRKQQHQKLKGNSRLIYLPLKYLSNARPNKIITSSSATVGGTKSSAHKLSSSLPPNSTSTSS